MHSITSHDGVAERGFPITVLTVTAISRHAGGVTPLMTETAGANPFEVNNNGHAVLAR